jgi:chemotaxis protein CheX
LRAAAPLAAELLSRRGKPVALDGAGVERLGGQCLQVLLSARATWSADGHSFQIDRPSTALIESLEALGAADLASKSAGEFLS